MSPATPTVSVIIPSRNRSQSLLHVLASLRRQAFDPLAMEVVVCLNDCRDDSRKALESLHTEFSLAVVEIAAAGAAAARNAAAAIAKGEVLIFLDDDIDPAPDFVSAHLRTHAQDRNMVGVGYSRPAAPGRGYLDLQKRGWWQDVFRCMAEPHHRFGFRDLLAGNFSVRRETFARVGGFDEQLNCREDYELGVRLLKAEARFTYCGAALGDHRDASTLERSLQRAKFEGAADMRLLQLHPELREELRRPQPTRLSRLVHAAGRCGIDLEPIMLRLATSTLDTLERLHLRVAWRRLQGKLQRFFYVHGAAWAPAAPAAPVIQPASPSSYDLAQGVAVVGCRLDAERPAAARFHFNGVDICSAEAGAAEPLQGRHLTGLLERHRREFAVGLACERVFGPGSEITIIDGGSSVGEIDVATWRLRTSANKLGERLLVRNGPRPMGWLSLPAGPPPGLEGFRAEIARQLPLAVCAEATLLELAAPSPSSPAITVVVCTRDRLQNLVRCLEALRALDYPDYQVLVVDNAPSDDQTERYVRGLGWPHYVRERRRGLDWARNRGVAEAAGDIVAFTDDDTQADRHWLTAIAAAFEQPEVHAVTGLVAPLRLDTAAQAYFEAVYGGMGKGFSPTWRRAAALRPRDLLWASAYGVGANMAFRRCLFDELGGFDVALDVGTAARGGGDIEFFHRIVSSGRTLAYQPSALIWHEHRSDWAGLRRQLEDNGCGFVSYLLAASRAGRASTGEVLEFVLRHWVGGWFIARLVRPGRHSRRLIWAEIRGALRGVTAYRRSLSAAARLAAMDTGPAA